MWKYRLRLWLYKLKKLFIKETPRKMEQFIYEYEDEKKDE